MKNFVIGWSTLLGALLSAVVVNAADFQLAAVFNDHMVLQCDRPVTVWGRAAAGQKVSVEFAGQTQAAVADAAGKWAVKLDASPAESKPQTLTATAGDQVRKCEDVLVGEVWHASGQSNMAMTAGEVAPQLDVVKMQLAAADLAAVRFVRINDGEAAAPLEDLRHRATWTVCTPQSAPNFSAVAFFFARKLHEELKKPVAVIDSSRGGTPIEPYIPRPAFDAHPTLRREVELADQNDLAGLKKLPGGVFARDANWLPGRLFHSRLAPLASFAVRGAVWYQGESNCGHEEDPRDYRHKMAALVNGWRTAFQNERLSVYFVQLPGSGAGGNWPALREEQRLTNLPHTGMVVTIDLVGGDIHPPNKVDVGERLARWALAKDYGKSIAVSGPLFAKAEVAENRVTVHFTQAESGLMIASKEGLQPPVETPNGVLNPFEVSDAAGEWRPAEATIVGQTVVVTSKAVERPVGVRYAYQVSPRNCNLYNRDGLPASPFQSP